MKIDVTRCITDLEGNTIEGATLRRIVCDALMGEIVGDDKLPGERKASMFALALRVSQEDAPDLKAEEIALIKERVGKACRTLAVGRAYELLDPPALQAVAN